MEQLSSCAPVGGRRRAGGASLRRCASAHERALLSSCSRGGASRVERMRPAVLASVLGLVAAPQLSVRWSTLPWACRRVSTRARRGCPPCCARPRRSPPRSPSWRACPPGVRVRDRVRVRVRVRVRLASGSGLALGLALTVARASSAHGCSAACSTCSSEAAWIGSGPGIASGLVLGVGVRVGAGAGGRGEGRGCGWG